MNNPLSLSVDAHGFLTLTIAGDLSGDDRLTMLREDTVVCSEAIVDAARRMGKKVPLMMDITQFSGEYDVAAIDIMLGFAKRNGSSISKTASFGGSAKARLAGEVIAALAGRENINLFDTEEEAVAWLKQP